MRASNTPFFSIVIPTYNRADYLLESINSILDQTFTSFEIIVVDDGSTDNTRKSVLSLASRHQSIRYIYQSNQERGAARNNGIKHAIGKWVGFLDSDDLFSSTHLAQIYTYLISNEAEFITTGYTFFPSSTTRLGQINSLAYGKVDLNLLLKGNPFACNVMFKRSLSIALFQESLSLSSMEDWIFLLENTSKYTLTFLPQSTVLMRDHPGRSMYSHLRAIAARECASQYLLSSQPFTRHQRVLLTKASNYFCAVHSYLGSTRLTSLVYLFSSLHVNMSFKNTFILFLKIVIGRKLFTRIQSFFNHH